ncbi:hypothetical protein ACFSX9_01490 [Flavobacterium ardleyense]|uniref:Uncharacterized protein n=1 Tax=Flavobacterium ardleyense TaxID=2038737 RepID=A0ABW5Z5Q7_9FLAO
MRQENKNSLEYIYSKKQSTIVEFDIESNDDKKLATNIQLISNLKANYPKNPTIAVNLKGEYGSMKMEF